MIEDDNLGYDAINDKSEVFRSPEKIEQLTASIETMWSAAEAQGATYDYQRELHRVENKSTPPGDGFAEWYHYEEKIPIQTPKLLRSEWRTYTNEAGRAFHWSLSRPADNPNAPILISLETPLGLPVLGMGIVGPNAGLEVGAAVKGYRVLEYSLGEEGKIHGRSFDYTSLVGNRIYGDAGGPRQWEATENEAKFITESLAHAELVTPSGKRTGITADALPEPEAA